MTQGMYFNKQGAEGDIDKKKYIYIYIYIYMCDSIKIYINIGLRRKTLSY